MNITDPNESDAPTLGHEEVLRRIHDRALAEGIRVERLEVSEGVVHDRALFDATGARVPFPEGAAYRRCFVALLDIRRRAKWAHDAWWAFVPADGSDEVKLQPTIWPPHPEGPVRFRETEPYGCSCCARDLSA